jgi:hypothetical protein
MPGPACFDLKVLHDVARGFGWAIEIADDIRKVATMQAHRVLPASVHEFHGA